MVGHREQASFRGTARYATDDSMTSTDDQHYQVGNSGQPTKLDSRLTSSELENVLLAHPCIVDAGVISILCNDGVTEILRAYIVRRTSIGGRCSKLTTIAIDEYMKAESAAYTGFNGGVFFIDHIPRTINGEIQRFRLAQMDRYRHNITEVLCHNANAVVKNLGSRGSNAEHDLKINVEQFRGTSRDASAQTQILHTVSPVQSVLTSRLSTQKRQRSSLADKIRELEASRLAWDSDMVLPSIERQ